MSFVDDRTSEIVHKKIKKIADEIKVAQSPELSKKEKERVVEELAKQSANENSQKVSSLIKKLNRSNSNDNKNQSYVLPSQPPPKIDDGLYEDAGIIESSINNNNKINPIENEYKNRPSILTKPALPPRSLKPAPQPYDQFSNFNQLENSSKLLNNKPPSYVHLHDKLLNSPKKVYEFKRRKETTLNKKNEDYEVYTYED